MSAKSQGSSLSLSITNPLVLYRALLATRRIRPDPAQHRLALELQQLYFRLKDYDPQVEYRLRLEKAARLSRQTPDGQEVRKAVFNDEPDQGVFSLSSLFKRNGVTASVMAMTRTIPIHDSAMDIDSPQGMLLYGEVGRGKSMLIDLLYSSLPTKKKRRWHFNTFILDVFRRLELARIERSSTPEELGLDHEHVILALARETMEKSPILFLDEFQMPDRVSGKLVHGFLTSFFSLGGVLVASSNRMPEELAKASGVEFSRMGATSRWGRGGQIWEKLSPGQRQARTDFGMFVEVLKKRCEIWEMEGVRDWRREHDEGNQAVGGETTQMDEEEAATILDSVAGAPTVSPAFDKIETSTAADTPPYFYVSLPSTTPEALLPTTSPEFSSALQVLNPDGGWSTTTLTVYARKVNLPSTSSKHGVALLPFPLLCASYLGPADYISIASSFHTLVVSQIPVLTLLQKNEARRFITFLDACYEARCRLMIEAAAPPDRLFFPETRAKRGSGNMLEDHGGDSIESEAFSEMYQDSTAPFRPNVSFYEEGDQSATPTPSLYNKSLRSVLADEDADFGPTYGNGRGYGPASDPVARDERDLRTTEPQGMEELEARQGPDFTQSSGVFTGQDEQFAYKRARSRLWEMCGKRWWNERMSRDPQEWWTPVQSEGRFWERKKDSILEDAVAKAVATQTLDGNATVDGSHDGSKRKADGLRDEGLFKHGASPFRNSTEPPPKFGWQHAWGMMRWGKRAGEWGKGVEGARVKEKADSDGDSR